MKALILLALASVCLFADDTKKETPKEPAKVAETKKAEPPKVTDAQQKEAWKASSRYNAAVAAKNKALADLAVASAEEEKARAALDATLGGLCPAGYVMQPDASGDPQCAVKPADPTMKK